MIYTSNVDYATIAEFFLEKDCFYHLTYKLTESNPMQINVPF